jgi:hypothetical protein
LSAGIDLIGCEYLGGCPAIGSKVLNKVELHFSTDGLHVAIAPQGLFTPATAHPVLTLGWPEITRVSMRPAHPGHAPAPTMRAVRSAVKVLTMRLDLPYQLTIETAGWLMNVGVRVAPDALVPQLQQLLDASGGPTPPVIRA